MEIKHTAYLSAIGIFLQFIVILILCLRNRSNDTDSQKPLNVTALPQPHDRKLPLLEHGTDLDPDEILPTETDESRRLRRNLHPMDTCNIFQMDFSDITCSVNPKNVTCHQKCKYGYELPNGSRQRRLFCAHSTNRWEPYGVEDCAPFVNCWYSVLPGGQASCRHEIVSLACNISCDAYDNLPNVREKNHTCDALGVWTPDLPHCVTPIGERLLENITDDAKFGDKQDIEARELRKLKRNFKLVLESYLRKKFKHHKLRSLYGLRLYEELNDQLMKAFFG